MVRFKESTKDRDGKTVPVHVVGMGRASPGSASECLKEMVGGASC